MDRFDIAYLIVIFMGAAFVAFLVHQFWNTPRRQYARRMRRESRSHKEHLARGR